MHLYLFVTMIVVVITIIISATTDLFNLIQFISSVVFNRSSKGIFKNAE